MSKINIELHNRKNSRSENIRKRGHMLFLDNLAKKTSVNLVSTYVDMSTTSTFLCDDCGETFSRRCGEVISKRTLSNNGNGCPNCKTIKGLNHSKSVMMNMVHDRLSENGILFYHEISNKRDSYLFTFLKCGCTHKLTYGSLRDYYRFKCPSCNKSDLHTRPHSLYYIEIHGRYKIGVAIDGNVIPKGNTIKRGEYFRYSVKEDIKNIRIIKTWDNLIRRDAFEMESKILNDYEWARYKGDPLFVDGTGTRELFTHDILGLDNEYKTGS